MGRSTSGNHSPNFKTCQCNKCGAVAHAPPDSTHRKCGGGRYALPPAERGKWESKQG